MSAAMIINAPHYCCTGCWLWMYSVHPVSGRSACTNISAAKRASHSSPCGLVVLAIFLHMHAIGLVLDRDWFLPVEECARICRHEELCKAQSNLQTSNDDSRWGNAHTAQVIEADDHQEGEEGQDGEVDPCRQTGRTGSAKARGCSILLICCLAVSYMLARLPLLARHR